MTNYNKTSIMLVALIGSLSGCTPPGQNLQANVYKADQVNSQQDAKVVEILAVMPAQVEADNTQQKQQAQIIGGVLGAIGGGVLGHQVADRGYQDNGAALGAAGGAAAGVAAGSLVPDKMLVEGVSITYKYKGKVLHSAQVGRKCEFKPGKAVVISTAEKETRVQPNATCPEKDSVGEVSKI